VYLFACGLYSTNPEIGQRGVAKATRAKFKLKKFSHSTVSRSYRTLEQKQKQAYESRFGEEFKVSDSESLTIATTNVTVNVKPEETTLSRKRFPSVFDTAMRRKEMVEFLQEYLYDLEYGNIEVASCQFVEYWHKKTQQLLL
jgi:hypothetical protein